MSHATNMLAAIEAVLEGKVTADVASYSIAGRSLTKIPLNELVELRAKYRAEVKQEELQAALALAGKKPIRRIVSRFV